MGWARRGGSRGVSGIGVNGACAGVCVVVGIGWVCTLILPSMSDLTGLKATEPRTSVELFCAVSGDLFNFFFFLKKSGYIPKSVVKLSAASRNSLVDMALSLLLSTGTSTKDFLMVSKKVPPAGI